MGIHVCVVCFCVMQLSIFFPGRGIALGLDIKIITALGNIMKHPDNGRK